MLLFTGNFAPALLVLFGAFAGLWGLLVYIGYWCFRRTAYYQERFAEASYWTQLSLYVIGFLLTFALSLKLFGWLVL